MISSTCQVKSCSSLVAIGLLTTLTACADRAAPPVAAAVDAQPSNSAVQRVAKVNGPLLGSLPNISAVNTIPTIDSTSWQTLASPTIPGPLRYSNDHTVIKGGDGNWHIIGINGNGSGNVEVALYHTILSSLYPPKPVSNTGSYSDLDAYGQAAPIAQYYDRNGTPCTAWAPSSIRIGNTVYLLYHSDRDNNGYCSRQASRLEILKSTDPALRSWTSVNTYPTAASPSTPVRFEISVTGTPSDMTSSTALYNTGWPNEFRDPGIFRDDDGTFLLYTTAYSRNLGHSVVAAYTSSDMLNWTYAGAALTLVNGATDVSWSAAESPFVFKRDGWYYLSFTDTNSNTATYENTVLLRSKDRLNFGTYDGTTLPKTGSNFVERLKVHAPEYVQDDADQWYITTCGWPNMSSVPQARQGVAIAKLQFAAAVPTNGLQAWYPFEPGVATDTSGNSHDGTFVGDIQAVTGVAGHAIWLSNGSYVSVAPIAVQDDFTIDGWVNPANAPSNRDGLFYTAEGRDFNFHGGYPRFWSGTGDVAVSSVAVPKGVWTHVAVTRANGTLSIYVNGVKTAQGTYALPFNIDSFGRTVAGTLTGGLDEVHVYNRALSAAEIGALRSLQAPTNGLMASYAFEQTDIGVGTDKSGNGHVGKLAGAAGTLTGIVDNALSLSGNSYMSVAPGALGGDFTVDGWVNTRSTPTNRDGLFHSAEGYDLNFHGGYPRFWAGSRDVLVSSVAVPPGFWTHVALTRSNGLMSIYVNGTRTAQGTFNGTLSIDSVGRTVAGTLTGALDEVHVYNRALSASEIATLMQTSSVGVGSSSAP